MIYKAVYHFFVEKIMPKKRILPYVLLGLINNKKKLSENNMQTDPVTLRRRNTAKKKAGFRNTPEASSISLISPERTA